MNQTRFLSLLFSLILFSCVPAFGQTARPERSVLFGLGKVNQLDTYLSPLEYEGPQLSLQHNILRPTHLSNGRIAFRSVFLGNVSMADTPADNANYLEGDIRYDASWLHRLPQLFPGMRWMAGTGVGTTIGGLYTTRSGNNPAQLHLQARFSASLLAEYSFHIKNKVLRARYEADLPLLGVMFAPNYGQSYYEIFSLGQYDRNAVFTHPANAFSLQQLLVLDISTRHGFFRVGYLSDIRHAKPNSLKQHQIGRSFMIGFVKPIK